MRVGAQSFGSTRRAGSGLGGGMGVKYLPGVPARVLVMVVNVMDMLREKARGTCPLQGSVVIPVRRVARYYS